LEKKENKWRKEREELFFANVKIQSKKLWHGSKFVTFPERKFVSNFTAFPLILASVAIERRFLLGKVIER